MEELNVSELKTAHPDAYGSTLAVPNFKALGARLGKRMAPVATTIKKLTPQQIVEFQKLGSITVEGETLGAEEARTPPCCSTVQLSLINTVSLTDRETLSFYV